MNNLDQSLNYPTITGLKSLDLDELTTVDFKANTIDGDIIYYNRIEGNEIIVDTTLTLTNTGVINVGDKTITDKAGLRITLPWVLDPKRRLVCYLYMASPELRPR